MPRPETTIRLGGDAATHRLAGTPTVPPAGRVVLERYRLDERIGAGGFGIVWRAHDLRLERDVAVKVIPRGDERAEYARVEREALAAARLNHPGIVGLYEFGQDADDIYLVSELVEGATLHELMAGDALSDRDVARVGIALCEALEHAHARGVVHRDVKPGNVMVLAEPAAGAGFAKLADFGIAQLASGETLTATGDVVGTLAYMAPEQAAGERVGPPCDVYALALTLYEGWTGSNPVRAANPAATARRVGRPLPPLRSRRGDLPPALCEVIDAALDPEPGFRPPPAELRDLLADVDAELDGEGGLVESETLERFGLTRVMPRTTAITRLLRRTVATRPGPAPPLPAPPAAAFPVADVPDQATRTDLPLGLRIATRAGAGLAAGGLVLAALQGLGGEPSFSPAAAAGAAALAVALLPRIGWIAAALGVCAWLASPEGDHPGTALALAAALAPVPLLLPRAGLLWSVPALAPLLGVVALGPLFVGLAALASTAWRRAGLAVAGFGWLAVAELLTGKELLFGLPDGAQSRGAWEGSFVDAAGDGLYPLLSSGALAPLAVWGAFAAVLPWIVRGRWAIVDLLAAVAWAAGLIAAHVALGDLLATTTELSEARGAVAGACLGALVVLTVTLTAPPARDHGAPQPALP